MKLTNLLILIFLVFQLTTLSYAAGLTCVGMDGSGQTLHLIFDVNTATININGKILEINGGSKDGKKMWTKNYISDQGILAKVILTHKKPGDDNSTLEQVNAITNDVIARAPLACKRFE